MDRHRIEHVIILPCFAKPHGYFKHFNPWFFPWPRMEIVESQKPHEWTRLDWKAWKIDFPKKNPMWPHYRLVIGTTSQNMDIHRYIEDDSSVKSSFKECFITRMNILTCAMDWHPSLTHAIRLDYVWFNWYA